MPTSTLKLAWEVTLVRLAGMDFFAADARSPAWFAFPCLGFCNSITNSCYLVGCEGSCRAWGGRAAGWSGRALLLACWVNGWLVDLLRPVYTGDFCRSNSMQFLSRSSCNKVRFLLRSNMFETWCNFGATKIASSCRDKNRLCKRALMGRHSTC